MQKNRSLYLNPSLHCLRTRSVSYVGIVYCGFKFLIIFVSLQGLYCSFEYLEVLNKFVLDPWCNSVYGSDNSQIEDTDQDTSGNQVPNSKIILFWICNIHMDPFVCIYICHGTDYSTDNNNGHRMNLGSTINHMDPFSFARIGRRRQGQRQF